MGNRRNCRSILAFSLDMKLEKNVWKLARIGGSASVQLDDPKVAATIVKTLQEQAAKASSPGVT